MCGTENMSCLVLEVWGQDLNFVVFASILVRCACKFKEKFEFELEILLRLALNKSVNGWLTGIHLDIDQKLKVASAGN